MQHLAAISLVKFIINLISIFENFISFCFPTLLIIRNVVGPKKIQHKYALIKEKNNLQPGETDENRFSTLLAELPAAGHMG